MAHLVAITYPGTEDAEKVLPTLSRLSAGSALELDDACIVVKDADGKVRLRQTLNLTTVGALGGAFWGSLIGLMFLSPLSGAAIGAAAGALSGHFTDYGISDEFMRDLAKQMPNGSSAIFMLVRRATIDRVVPEIAKLGGRILYTSVSPALEREFQRSLDQARGEPTQASTDAPAAAAPALSDATAKG